MNQVAKVQTTDRNINQLQSNMVPALNQVLGNPLVQGQILTNVTLNSGANTINTKLNKALTGWFPIRFHGAWAQIYDTQDSNPNPDSSLQLVAGASVTVDLWVF